MTHKIGISIRSNVLRQPMKPYKFFEKQHNNTSGITFFPAWNKVIHLGKYFCDHENGVIPLLNPDKNSMLISSHGTINTGNGGYSPIF